MSKAGGLLGGAAHLRTGRIKSRKKAGGQKGDIGGGGAEKGSSEKKTLPIQNGNTGRAKKEGKTQKKDLPSPRHGHRSQSIKKLGGPLEKKKKKAILEENSVPTQYYVKKIRGPGKGKRSKESPVNREPPA